MFATQMKGCEAWVALCAGNTTKVAQCTQPGPVPKLPSTMIVREAINSLCSTHYMDGCYECEPSGVAVAVAVVGSSCGRSGLLA